MYKVICSNIYRYIWEYSYIYSQFVYLLYAKMLQNNAVQPPRSSPWHQRFERALSWHVVTWCSLSRQKFNTTKWVWFQIQNCVFQIKQKKELQNYVLQFKRINQSYITLWFKSNGKKRFRTVGFKSNEKKGLHNCMVQIKRKGHKASNIVAIKHTQIQIYWWYFMTLAKISRYISHQ